jgi:hypothetical protein
MVYYTISDESAWFSTSNTWYTHERQRVRIGSIASWKIALWSGIVYTIFSNVAYENESQF